MAANGLPSQYPRAIPFRTTDEQGDALDALATELGCTRTDLIREAIALRLAQTSGSLSLIREAIAMAQRDSTPLSEWPGPGRE